MNFPRNAKIIVAAGAIIAAGTIVWLVAIRDTGQPKPAAATATAAATSMPVKSSTASSPPASTSLTPTPTTLPPQATSSPVPSPDATGAIASESSVAAPQELLVKGLNTHQLASAQNFVTEMMRILAAQSPRETQEGRETLYGGAFTKGTPVPKRPVDHDDAAIGVLDLPDVFIDSSTADSITYHVRAVLGGSGIVDYKFSRLYLVTVKPELPEKLTWKISEFQSGSTTNLTQNEPPEPLTISPHKFVAAPAEVADDQILPPRGLLGVPEPDPRSADEVALYVTRTAFAADALTDVAFDEATRRTMPWLTEKLTKDIFVPFSIPATDAQWSLVKNYRAFVVTDEEPYLDARDLPEDSETHALRTYIVRTQALGDNAWKSTVREYLISLNLVKVGAEWRVDDVSIT